MHPAAVSQVHVSSNTINAYPSSRRVPVMLHHLPRQPVRHAPCNTQSYISHQVDAPVVSEPAGSEEPSCHISRPTPRNSTRSTPPQIRSFGTFMPQYFSGTRWHRLVIILQTHCFHLLRSSSVPPTAVSGTIVRVDVPILQRQPTLSVVHQAYGASHR